MDQPTTEEPRGRFQYILKDLFLFTTWVAAVCAAAMTGPCLGVVFLVLAAIIMAIVSGRYLFALTTLLCLVALGLLLTILNQGRYPHKQLMCCINLKQINVALLEYMDQHDTFPPAYIAGTNGKPMHSWRVLILPYLGRQDLYDAYDFNEPWDGPNNRKLADKCPKIFTCPADKTACSSPHNTSYVAIVGPHAAWTGKNGLTRDDFPDGMSETLVVVETADSGINWMEPRDLYVGQMARTVNANAGQGISSKHAGGFHAAFADGSFRNLSEDLPPETLDALITRDGGETVDPDAL